MIAFNRPSLRKVLCLGAHADDLEIGCGGTVLQLSREQPDREVWWVVFSAEGARAGEARASGRAFLAGAARSRIVVKRFRTSFFPVQMEAIKDAFERIKAAFEPDLVLTHYRDDRHQDHRVLSDLAWNTFRHHLILEYEIPKYDGDLGQPNAFVALDDETVQAKMALLFRHFPSQASKHWFTEDIFRGLMRLRGMECASRYAEAFYCRKMLL